MPPRKPIPAPAKAPSRRMKGFEPAASLLAERIRSAGESRGFAVSKVLTHWTEIVGEDIAARARPVKVGYGGKGFGATLTLLASPAHAPVVQMQLPRIRDRVNACYGYAAIARVTLTQTTPHGFAEARAAFAPAPGVTAPPVIAPPGVAEPHADPAPPDPAPPDLALAARADAVASGVQDDALRAALAALARSVIDRAARSR